MSAVLIDHCSRADLIKDGTLIEVESSILKEVGIKYPTAVTCGIETLLNDMPEHESFEARVYDMLDMFTQAIKGNITSRKYPEGAGEALVYEFILNDSLFNGTPKMVEIKVIVGPGDYPEEHPSDVPPPPVLTFMLPSED